MDRQWLKTHAEEEISDAKMYFEAAENATGEDREHLICMAKQELEHAGHLFEMMS